MKSNASHRDMRHKQEFLEWSYHWEEILRTENRLVVSRISVLCVCVCWGWNNY